MPELRHRDAQRIVIGKEEIRPEIHRLQDTVDIGRSCQHRIDIQRNETDHQHDDPGRIQVFLLPLDLMGTDDTDAQCYQHRMIDEELVSLRMNEGFLYRDRR